MQRRLTLEGLTDISQDYWRGRVPIQHRLEVTHNVVKAVATAGCPRPRDPSRSPSTSCSRARCSSRTSRRSRSARGPPSHTGFAVIHFNKLRFKQSQNINDFSAAHVILKCRLLKGTAVPAPRVSGLRSLVAERLGDSPRLEAAHPWQERSSVGSSPTNHGSLSGKRPYNDAGVREQSTLSMQAFALQSSSRNCPPPSDLVV